MQAELALEVLKVCEVILNGLVRGTVPTRRLVAAARSPGCPVHVWTINDAATARGLWARGVAGIV